MFRNKLILAALSSTLIFGAAAGAGFAAPGDGPRQHPGRHGPGPAAFREITYVRMLKQFDTNKDGQVSKDEVTAGLDKIFAAIDTNKDGSLTPGEIREYRKTQMQAMRGQRKQETGENKDANAAAATADNNDQGRLPREGHDGRDGHRWMRHGGNIMRASIMMQRIDTDQNGQISKQEATAAFDKLFARMDRNKDGVISIDDMPDRPLL
ncbi:MULTISPECIES: EF-hand domain-containing protein [Rhizobium]|jgi:Ca2+-binding EF-hand superfamily protein|uniref:EF-hand domain-containing protein n=1 Tax=Rhizobium TaxID=379 RepID=UPI000378D9E0|nr:EF-hand domain-containing protein [Rhizobium leguminosarum]MBY5771114.1 calcium-binding protein [Rhizobium leguminosarum]MBY5776330.1 calcium-binding protein [Rhizobium leguminosarum]MBY5797084.1 calcium-binding protein [Rhizobium leguminosarum]TBY86096.1 calcium-binding protein [Rhizobium leguminosarum bv. viciae]TBZ19439.1 calcium-binding protein [Rhizobium leguminosarum bv. viciae]